MARKKKKYYAIISEGVPIGPGGRDMLICSELAQAKVECYSVVKSITGDEEAAIRYMNSIDDDFYTPPYPESEKEDGLSIRPL